MDDPRNLTRTATVACSCTKTNTDSNQHFVLFTGDAICTEKGQKKKKKSTDYDCIVNIGHFVMKLTFGQHRGDVINVTYFNHIVKNLHVNDWHSLDVGI